MPRSTMSSSANAGSATMANASAVTTRRMIPSLMIVAFDCGRSADTSPLWAQAPHRRRQKSWAIARGSTAAAAIEPAAPAHDEQQQRGHDPRGHYGERNKVVALRAAIVLDALAGD